METPDLSTAADNLKALAAELVKAEDELRTARSDETRALNARDGVRKRFDAARKALDEAAARIAV